MTINRIMATLLVAVFGCLVATGRQDVGVAQRNYDFQGRISRQVLENYLSRATTFCELLNSVRTEGELHGSVEDNIRCLGNMGAKFIGRSIYMWGRESRFPGLLQRGKEVARRIHTADPDIVLQACAFEIVTKDVEKLNIPRWVFDEFALEYEHRSFKLEEMRYADGHMKDKWNSPNAIVPDISKLETRMWFYFLVRNYIDIGIEAIHFGQVEIMDDNDKDHRHWQDLLRRVRQYAQANARRELLICDGHVPGGGLYGPDGRLLLDFHSFPLRIEEVTDTPEQGQLIVGHFDSIFGRSAGGITPSGWECQNLPYLVEFDNFGSSGKEGRNIGRPWIWGYDEIGWWARQSDEYRRMWLYYAWCWVRSNDPNGYLQMPGARVLHYPVKGRKWYYVNTPGEKTPAGFGDEQTVKNIWAGDRDHSTDWK